ncbi:MAG: NAD(P)/FAD-dependent oxidoreductase [Oleiphilaceae bacterium]|nr:NAD(P)/FAD-dependent oxidoreductase [Oleiphilaceae bacterium]
MTTRTRIVIIGAGFSGLGMAIRLKKAGYSDFVLLEQGDDIGGAWHQNHYPGCACDVQSALYCFSFEPNPDWSRAFASQGEIKAYLKYCAGKYDLNRHIRFDTHVAGARFDENRQTWTLETANSVTFREFMQRKGLKPGDEFDRSDAALPPFESVEADIFISAVGALSKPAYPAIAGLNSFTGKAFHSQHWDHSYDLKGKRVAVIGTGASAIQFVPEVAKKAARLDVYQRTPPWILPKPDRAISTLERALFRRLPPVLKALRNRIYWMLEARGAGFVLDRRLLKLGELQSRRHIRSQISDRALRRKVTPSYEFGCKRVLLSNNYYPALTRPHVNLLTDGADEVRDNAILDKAGNEREVDCIIYGTGFQAQNPIARGTVFGRQGLDLMDVWQNGAEAYKGTTVAGFPNFFLLMGPNTGLGHNSMVYMIECQINYVMGALHEMHSGGWRSLEVKADAQRRYTSAIHARLKHSVWQTGGCNSWYFNGKGRNTVLWPDFSWKFRQQMQTFDATVYHCEHSEP